MSRIPYTLRLLPAAALTLLLALTNATLANPSHAAAQAKADTTRHGPAAAAAPASAVAPAVPMIDPLDAVLAKLARKLGAATVAHDNGSGVVRVASRGKADLPTTAARPAARKPARRVSSRQVETAAQPHGHSTHWSYSGENGPQAWGELTPEFAACAKGTRQSPIDIRGGIAVDLEAIAFDYRASGFAVIDNGHTVQVNVAPGNSIQVLGRRFELLQFHFHRPSEERIDGRQFDMVVHLVHKDLDGRLAVIAVMLERGSVHPLVQAVWNNLPLEKGEEVAARATIDLNHLLPQQRGYYTYMGSLTTPPCTEGVLWMVMQQPVTASPEQIGIFARLYPMNARALQSASGRLIKQSN